ncbi:hypothetical protein [Nocardioides pacificus]
MDRLVRLVAASAAALLTLGLLAAPAPAAAPVRLDPTELERGPDSRLPHLDGATIVDGERRIPVRADVVRLLGRAGDGYVVVADGAIEDGRGPALRVEADGTTTRLSRRVDAWSALLSRDGLQLVELRHRGRDTRVSVRDASTGDVVRRRDFAGQLDALDADAGRVILSEWDRGTRWWSTSTGRLRRISARPGQHADIRADRLASYTGDPYQDGCTVVSRLSAPRRVLWRSCRERVEAFSPTGRRLATVHILADGRGPNQVWVRGARGALKASFRAYSFGRVVWESDRALLMDTYTARRTATVRCVGTACERASRIRRSELG